MFRRSAAVGAATLVLLAPATAGCSFVEKHVTNRAAHHPADTNCEYHPTDRAARQVDLPPAQAPTHPVNLTLNTSDGPIGITLDPTKAPCAVNSITHLAGEGFYDDTVCHRITTSGLFVLQCGDPTGTGAGGPGYTFSDEYPVNQSNSTGLYRAGTVAMANSGRNTNGSQFFLTYKDSKLPPNYTVVGTIDEAGMGVLGTIADRGTSSPSGDGAPSTPVRVETARVGDAH